MSKPSGARPLKVLMLHGYTQSGDLFRSKTRALEKHLVKSFPGTTFSWPTGPLQLRPTDIPGYDPEKFDGSADSPASFGWWRRADDSPNEPVEYLYFDEGMETIAKVLESEGPFDGVIGFSQGACAAGMIASLLEAGEARKQSFESHQSKNPVSISYPSSFAKLDHPPLKFCIPYCGFAAPGDRYQALYDPPIKTPSCHILGSLDTLVDEARGRTLIDAFGGEGDEEGKAKVVWHPGSHFVPQGKQYLNAVVEFIKGCVDEEGAKKREKEERVEDMDVPF